MCWWSAANFLHLLRVLLSAKQLKDMLRMLLISITLEEELEFLVCFMAKLLFCLA